MPDGNDMMDDMKFEALIKDYSPAEQFLARQIRLVKKECEARKYCPASFQLSRKQIAVSVGGVGSITTVIYWLFDIIKQLLSG